MKGKVLRFETMNMLVYCTEEELQGSRRSFIIIQVFTKLMEPWTVQAFVCLFILLSR